MAAANESLLRQILVMLLFQWGAEHHGDGEGGEEKLKRRSATSFATICWSPKGVRVKI
jgi:hypothetical protein